MTNMMDDFMAECEFVGAKKQTIKTVKKMIKMDASLIQKLLVLQI